MTERREMTEPPNPGRNALPAGYVHKPSWGEPEKHKCPLPAEWELGAVWRCPEGHLWTVNYGLDFDPFAYRKGKPQWMPANWFLRFKFRGKRAKLEMSNLNQRKTAYNTKPPKTPGGVATPDYDG